MSVLAASLGEHVAAGFVPVVEEGEQLLRAVLFIAVCKRQLHLIVLEHIRHGQKISLRLISRQKDDSSILRSRQALDISKAFLINIDALHDETR